jgi:hypothetical protein
LFLAHQRVANAVVSKSVFGVDFQILAEYGDSLVVLTLFEQCLA